MWWPHSFELKSSFPRDAYLAAVQRVRDYIFAGDIFQANLSQRFEAARASRIAAEAQLRGEEERFRAGLSTNFFVLDRQNQLSEARGREAQALTDYNKAIVELQRVTGTTMAANNVTVTSQQP